jgi:DNA-binding GntR family transcriptional regulator
MRIGPKRVSSDREQRRRRVLEHARILKAIEQRDGERVIRLGVRTPIRALKA